MTMNLRSIDRIDVGIVRLLDKVTTENDNKYFPFRKLG